MHKVVLLHPNNKVAPQDPGNDQLALHLSIIYMALYFRGTIFYLHISAVSKVLHIGAFEFNKAKLGVFSGVKNYIIRGSRKPGVA